METSLWIALIATLILVIINFIASLPERLRIALNIIIVIGLLVYLTYTIS